MFHKLFHRTPKPVVQRFGNFSPCKRVKNRPHYGFFRTIWNTIFMLDL